MHAFLFLATLCAQLGSSFASPLPLQSRAVTQISADELASFAPFTQFARAAYCPTDSLQDWTCGEACAANSDFEVSLVGGNGDDVQIYFVGYSPSQDSIIVAHEGTDPTALESDLTDVNAVLGSLDSALFPGISSSVQVHTGFRDEHALTAAAILAEVNTLMTSKGTTKIITVGHSLGGALSELDSLYLHLNLPSGTSVSAMTYGTPRVGNSDWAGLIDANVNYKRIDNKDDLIPIVPGRGLGYAHPAGEIHILGAGDAVSCPGEDDATDSECQIQSVPNIFEGNIIDHLGPYEGIFIGTIFCT